MTFGEKLKYYRKARNWTQTELSQRSGVGQQQIARYESGQRFPKFDKRALLTMALQVKDLFMEDNSPYEYVPVYLRRLREMCGITADQLGKGLTVPMSGRNITDVELGMDLPNSAHLLDIIRVLESELDGKGLNEDQRQTAHNMLDVLKESAGDLKDQEEALAEMYAEGVQPETGPSLTPEEWTIIECYNNLNEDGKIEAVKRLEELTQIPKYQKKNITE